jgi:hypothetical protein
MPHKRNKHTALFMAVIPSPTQAGRLDHHTNNKHRALFMALFSLTHATKTTNTGHCSWQ